VTSSNLFDAPSLDTQPHRIVEPQLQSIIAVLTAACRAQTVLLCSPVLWEQRDARRLDDVQLPLRQLQCTVWNADTNV